MTKRYRGLVAAMESQVESLPVNDTQPLIDENPGSVPAATEVVELEFPECEDSAETSIIETKKVEAVVISLEENIEDALEVIERIEAVAEIVEGANEEGGLNLPGAELLQVTLEGFYHRLGMAEVKHGFALENFGGVTSRTKGTSIAVEDIKEKLVEIWKRIVATIKTMIAKGSEFLKQLLDTTARLKARQAKTKEALKVAQAGSWKIAKVQNGRLASQLAIGNEVPRDLTARVGVIVQAAQAIDASVKVYATTAGSKFLSVLNTAGSLTPEVFATQMQGAGEALIQAMGGAEKAIGPIKNFFPQDDDTLRTESDTFLGNRVFVVSSKKPIDGSLAEIIAGVKTIHFTIESKQAEVDETIATLGLDGARSLSGSIDALIAEIENVQKSAQDYLRVKTSLLAAANSAINKAPEHPENAQAVQAVLFPVVRSIETAPSLIIRYLQDVAKALLDFTEVSAKAGKVAPAPGQLPNAAADAAAA